MNIIKYTKPALWLLIPALGLWSCLDKLDQVPETVITDENYWNTPNDLATACNYLYTLLPRFEDQVKNYTSKAPGATYLPMDNMADDAFSLAGANVVSEGSRLAPAATDDWTNNYDLIRASNNILENAHRVTGTAAEINKYKGEARFFRAFAYFELVKRFGDVPLVMKTLDASDPELFGGRTSRETVLDSVYADLDYAAANLPQPDAQPASQYGRITSTAALALKSGIALFEGTRQKFHQYGNYQKHLQVAVSASDAVINGGKHALFNYAAKPDSSYYYLFQYVGEGKTNKENMLVFLYAVNASNYITNHSWMRTVLGNGNYVPTQSILDAYLYKDGLPMDKSPYYQEQTNSLTQFENRDPRMGMTVFNKNHWYIASNYVTDFQNTPTGYKIRKYFTKEDHSNNMSFIDRILIRYAEVLLNNAEAKFELNGSISDEDLNKTINLLRDRVGMIHLTNAFVAANGLDMRTEIRRERRIELALEGFRYWDLIRWKTAETELPKTLKGTKYFPDEYGTTAQVTIGADGFVVVQDVSKRHFDPQRDYLWPLPLQELGLNPNLGDNNPNW